MANKSKRSPRIIEGTGKFLVRVDGAGFYVGVHGDGRPRGTYYPSQAAHLTYEAADELCQRLQAMGYRDAVVTDLMGQSIDLFALDREREKREERSRRFWGE